MGASDTALRLVGTNLTAALRRHADYTSKWIVSRWRTQRPNRRRSDSECYGDLSPTMLPCTERAGTVYYGAVFEVKKEIRA